MKNDNQPIKVDCFIIGQCEMLISSINLVKDSNILLSEITISSPGDTQALRRIAAFTGADYVCICLRPELPELSRYAMERMIDIARSSGAGMVYSDFYERRGNTVSPHPLIDYRKGSLRDDFDFGPMALYTSRAFKQAVELMTSDFRYAALYDLRLKISQRSPVAHINEYLYTVSDTSSSSSSHEKQFEYVDPKNRLAQFEMEQACTDHLKQIGGYLHQSFNKVDFLCDGFKCEASVVIPVRNRVNTIADAISSALDQTTDFEYNVIVIDNHSTDGTGDEIRRYCSDRRLIHIIPKDLDLGIGGCWNEAVMNTSCGKFAVQLDSDDRYSSRNSLQQIVRAFYDTQSPMIIGSYQMTDINWNPIPPGLIDHKEWTPYNGHNNALRINGLGAPRAFFTPIVRHIKFPNTSYGEDYAMGLRISRDYEIGRIYNVLYDCRRWDGNSDTRLSQQKANEYNSYKDNLRTWELEARIRKNKNGNL
ncbi:MAG: glycosyltransferase [Tannerellaceae bacterium]|jgi:hypothetical protein|nr:glycosyltransferase [Tannerellaceae bacterium]